MSGLIGQRGVVAFGVPEALERWHLDTVGTDGVIRLIATVPDIGPGCCKKAFSVIDTLHRIENRLRELM